MFALRLGMRSFYSKRGGGRNAGFLKADTEVQTRHDELAGKNTEGVLSTDERAELESLVRANSTLSFLKAEARAFLQQPKAA